MEIICKESVAIKGQRVKPVSQLTIFLNELKKKHKVSYSKVNHTSITLFVDGVLYKDITFNAKENRLERFNGDIIFK